MNTLFLSILPGAGPVAIGYYNPAISLCRQAMLLPNCFRQVAFPAVSANSDNLNLIKGLIAKSTKFLVILVAFPLVIATSFFPREIITIVFGAQYLPSVPALIIFGWAFALQIYNAPVTVTLAASRDIKKLIPWRMLIFGIDLVLALPLIWYYSFVGAAVAFLISKIVETFLRHHLLKVFWGLQVDTLASIVKFIAPMALIFIVLFLVNLVAGGTFKFLVLSVLMYSVYLYRCKVHRSLAAHIPGLRGRF